MLDLRNLKPSALLRLAATDMLKFKENGGVLHMGTWREDNYRGKGTCNACMAGAVMVNTLDAQELDGKFEEYKDQMYALDDFRVGDVKGFYLYLTLVRDNSLPNMDDNEFDFDGVLTDKEINELVAHARYWADLFELRGE